MNLNREVIFTALAQHLTAQLVAPAGPFVSVGRRLKQWDDVGAAQQPCLFVEQRDQFATQRSQGGHFGLTKWVLEAWLWVYAYIDAQPSTLPATQLNDLLDAVEQALLPTRQGDQQKLGIPDLVTHCWIEGNVFVNEGVTEQQSIMVIPVYIVTGNY